ncbi:MAG: hypothetical protein Q8910_18180, partial [Bacteroidota bacterium]|nr:hypothetical protein [Bacteroidota bacterium]
MLQKIIKRPYLMAFTSGMLSFFAVLQMVFLLSWVCYVLFFLSLKAKSIRQTLSLGFTFGIALSIPSFYWVIAGAGKYTAAGGLYGLAAFLLVSLIFCLYWSVLSISFTFLQVSLRSPKWAILLNALLVSALWTLGEALLRNIFSGMPWFAYNTGFGLLKNLYAVQPASLGGISVISFVVVLVNFLISEFIFSCQWRNLSLPALIIIAYLLLGYFILARFDSLIKSAPVKVAILA